MNVLVHCMFGAYVGEVLVPCMLGPAVGVVLVHCILGAAVGEFFGALYVRSLCR